MSSDLIGILPRFPTIIAPFPLSAVHEGGPFLLLVRSVTVQVSDCHVVGSVTLLTEEILVPSRSGALTCHFSNDSLHSYMLIPRFPVYLYKH